MRQTHHQAKGIAMFLTPEQLLELTGKSRRAAQVRALTQMGLEHTVRPDGKVIILRSHVERRLDSNIENKVRRRIEPNWNAINA